MQPCRLEKTFCIIKYSIVRKHIYSFDKTVLMYTALYDLTTPTNVKPTEYTQSGQWPTSGVHSIMMEKSALAGKRGGCTLVTITYKVAVYAPAEMADTLPPFFFYTPICTLWSSLTSPFCILSSQAPNSAKICILYFCTHLAHPLLSHA